MLAAATLPALMARLPVAGPVWQSPPQETPVEAGHGAVGLGHDLAALGCHAELLEGLGVDGLADGDDDDVTVDDHRLALSVSRSGTTTLEPADDLAMDAHAPEHAVCGKVRGESRGDGHAFSGTVPRLRAREGFSARHVGVGEVSGLGRADGNEAPLAERGEKELPLASAAGVRRDVDV